MIMQDTLPRIKSFLKPAGFSEHVRGYLVRMITAFLTHRGRMSATRAAGSVGEDARHRAQVGRFLAGGRLGNGSPGYRAMAAALIDRETRRTGRWLFIVDKTCVSRQGTKTENTFSTGNRKRRPKKGRRFNKKRHTVKRCHGFVVGLLITPSGYRIPFHRCYYTREYCELKKCDHRTEAELAAALIRSVPTPDGVHVVVLGDTAYEAESIRAACSSRGFAWITPANPERVLAGEKPRPKLSTRLQDLEADRFSSIRLTPGKGDYVAQRRVAGCRVGPKAKTRTFYACQERLTLHSVGAVQTVFSRKESSQNGQPIDRETTKILLTNDLTLSMAAIVELYDLRWQIELFFKELKTGLGLHQYGFRAFAKVEGWVESCLASYLYLETYRAAQLAKRTLSNEARRWWQRQRTHGLKEAACQEAERTELTMLADWSRTKTGLKKLKRTVRAARPHEYQIRT